MHKMEFPSEVLKQIEHDRYHHPCPQIQKRMEILSLASHKLPQKEIVRLSGASLSTVKRRLADYRRGGLEAVTRWDLRGQPSALNAHATDLDTHFEENPPATVAEAMRVIEERTGVRRGRTQVCEFLKKGGWSTARPKASPQKPTPSRKPSSARRRSNPF